MSDGGLLITLPGEEDTIALGAALGGACKNAAVIFLSGELGAGKTTLCRGLLSAFGHSGAVKSPTYTLVEPYEFESINVFHFDLYRLGHPEELEYMGIRDYFNNASLCIVEWHEKGKGILPQPDMIVGLTHYGDKRRATLTSQSPLGLQIITNAEKAM